MGLHWDVRADCNPAAGCNEMRASLIANSNVKCVQSSKPILIPAASWNLQVKVPLKSNIVRLLTS